MAIAVIAVAGALAAPLAHGDDAPPELPATAVASESAERLIAWQVAETQPPPSTVLGDSLEIPADSGTGRRVVYSKAVMRVWMIEEDGSLYHTHRVSGLDSQPRPGTYAVWSRSSSTCSNASPDICMRWMVRFAHSFRGDNIGFHEIPRRRGVPLQDLSQLGLALSGGCVRQSTEDALVMWDWAQIGTVVVVVG
jgi:hypothetical protein